MTLTSVASIALLVVFGGCATVVPLRRVVEIPLPVAWRGASEDLIGEAIWRAGRKQSWEIEEIEPGRLRGTRRWKRHVAVVSITHDRQQLRVAYEGSENLRRQGDQIHRAYDTVVQRLVASIEQEPLVPGARPSDPGAAD